MAPRFTAKSEEDGLWSLTAGGKVRSYFALQELLEDLKKVLKAKKIERYSFDLHMCGHSTIFEIGASPK